MANSIYVGKTVASSRSFTHARDKQPSLFVWGINDVGKSINNVDEMSQDNKNVITDSGTKIRKSGMFFLDNLIYLLVRLSPPGKAPGFTQAKGLPRTNILAGLPGA